MLIAISRGPDLFDIEFRAGTEAAFTLKEDKPLTKEEVVKRITTISGWFAKDFDSSTLSDADQAKYKTIEVGVAKARLAALQQAIKRETGKAPSSKANEAELLATIVDEAFNSLSKVYFEAGDHKQLILVNRQHFHTLIKGLRHGYYCEQK